MNEAGRHEWHLSLIRSLIAFVEQRDIQRDFRDPPSHLWTVAHESSLDADTECGSTSRRATTKAYTRS
jgi:hypothetical protein